MESNFSHGFPNFPFSLFTKHQDSLSLSHSSSPPFFSNQPHKQTISYAKLQSTSMCLVYSFNPTLLGSFKTELMQQEVPGIFHDVLWELHQMERINEDFHCITTIFDIKVDSLITWCHLRHDLWKTSHFY